MTQSIKRETASLLLEFCKVDSEKESLFYEKWDEKIQKIERKMSEGGGNLRKDHKKAKPYWRDNNSITADFYWFLRRNFPVPIPYVLFFPSSEIKINYNVIYNRCKGDLADKWLKDIFSRESFYKRNKEYFTRAEVKYFLTCDGELANCYDLINYFFITKIKANNLDLSLGVFHRFMDCFIHQTAIGFIKFLCNNKKHIKNKEEEIIDICDFLKTEYINNDRNFNFENMTWHELKRLSDEWHLENRIANDPHLKEYINTSWKKSSIKDFTFEKYGKTWTIKEITAGIVLYEEGEKMHHCVFSYADDCIEGRCYIFSVSCNGRIATVEISKDKELIQARGPCNNSIDNETASIIKIWADENKIDCGSYLFDRLQIYGQVA